MKNFCKIIYSLVIFIFLLGNFTAEAASYETKVFPLENNGYKIYLSKLQTSDGAQKKSVLLIHGLTYSSHVFDVDFADYSFVKFLARNGYAVWRLDVAGYGRSQAVTDGFLPDSDYAAKDILAAVNLILNETGEKKIDVIGWSWGTVTCSRFAAKNPELVNKIVLYAPILSGLGAENVTAPFHKNDWIHAADDFQKLSDGKINPAIVEPAVAATFLSNCWHYDKDSSPNGGRRDLMTPASNQLIFVENLKVPVMIIEGTNDGYINREMLKKVLPNCPEGSEFVEIEGGGHAMMIEKPFYKNFRNAVLKFLKR